MWILLLCGFFGRMLSYGSRPGSSGQIANDWPDSSRIIRASDRPTLLVFMHPECECSQATLEEIDLTLAQVPEPPQVQLIFMTDSPRAVQDGPLWAHAGRLPHAERLLDRAGREAKIFGVKTSGHTLLFDPRGNLLFSGGVTGSRGHVGDNPGQLALEDALRSPTSTAGASPIFGCDVFGEKPRQQIAAFFAGVF